MLVSFDVSLLLSLANYTSSCAFISNSLRTKVKFKKSSNYDLHLHFSHKESVDNLIYDQQLIQNSFYNTTQQFLFTIA